MKKSQPLKYVKKYPPPQFFPFFFFLSLLKKNVKILVGGGGVETPLKADQPDSLKKICILSENVIFHE